MRMSTFTKAEIDIFKSMIGKRFNKFKHDPFVYSPMVYGIVGIYVDDVAYELTVLCTPTDRFGNSDEVAMLHIEQSEDSKIKTFMDNGDLIETPVSSKIVRIDIVNDHQLLEHDGHTSSFDYSVGVIFHLEDSREISFEIKTWFSEMISIDRGYSLISKFTPIDDFLEEWEGCDGYIASCKREILTIT